MKKQDPTILIFGVVSVLFHLLLGLGLFWILPKLQPLKSAPEMQAIEVMLQDQGYQIADIEPPEKEERPKDSKFLGLYDSTVEKQQVSNRPSSEAARGSQKAERSPENKKEKEKETPTKPGEGMQMTMKAEQPSSKTAESPGSEEEGVEGLPEDFFPDFQVGERTYLNVLRFPKVGYFVRLKKIFKTTWNPSSAIRASIGGVQISRGQIEVVLAVTVDPAGRLAELNVLRSSGLPLYDTEALRTIRDSAPFAAPPAELINAPNGLRMAWTFSVYL